MIRRICLSLLILQGCASAFDDIFLVVKNQTFGHPNQEITNAAYNQSEFSFMTLKIGRNAKVKLILNSVEQGVYEWISSDLNTIYTYNGLIVKSSGLPHNIALRNYQTFSPNTSTQFSSSLEFDEPLLVGVIANFNLIGSSGLIEGNNIYKNLDAFTFTREVRSIGWKSNDVYWVNDDNLVVYALQEVHPYMPAIEIEYFYKF
jgi:hypothetical protein